MKLNEVLEDEKRGERYPTVVTDAGFLTLSFNEAAGKLFDGICGGTDITKIAGFPELEYLRGLRYPSTTVAIYGDVEYFCFICPAEDGFDTKYVFFFSLPEDGDQYITMKASVISWLSSDEITHGKFGSSKLEAVLRLSAAFAGGGLSTVHTRSLLDDAFSYYCRAKYGDDRKRYALTDVEDYVIMNKETAAALVICFRISTMLSSNGYCEVSAADRDNVTSFRFVFRPGRDLRVSLDSGGSEFHAFYRALGKRAEELYFVKCLMAGASGRTDTGSEDGAVFIEISFDHGRRIELRSYGTDHTALLRAVADFLLFE